MSNKPQKINYFSEIVTRVVAFVISISALFLLFNPSLVVAHGTGLAMQNTVGDYSIDIHYPYPFQAGMPTFLNFFLNQSQGDVPVSFSDIDISILKNDDVVLKTNANRKIGVATGAIITFPDGGNYKINTIFNQGNTKIVKTSFLVDVAEREGVHKVLGIEINKELGIGTVLGIVLLTLFSRINRHLEESDDD
jgi:hypothetical protein